MSQSFQLKGRLFTLSVLTLTDLQLDLLERSMQEKIKLAPKFFDHAPIVLDISDLSGLTADFQGLRKVFDSLKLIPVGIKGLKDEWIESAHAAGFAKMTDTQTDTPSPANITQRRSMVIHTPIRSGQQVYAQGADMIVLSSVSPGAELLADGHIHVYNTLRGRVLAGVNGDETARIFCHRMEAELVAIAGHYKVFEELQTEHDGVGKQIFLDKGQLRVENL
jgi:septum site-determining protein MinC